MSVGKLLLNAETALLDSRKKLKLSVKNKSTSKLSKRSKKPKKNASRLFRLVNIALLNTVLSFKRSFQIQSNVTLLPKRLELQL